MTVQNKEAEFLAAKEKLIRLKKEIQTFIVGQEETIDQVLWTIFSGGHALLEGLPGLGKTMLIRTIAEVMDLSFSRIQFTPDLMPADITGTVILQRDERGQQSFHFHEGPIFSHIVLADEINRATPKTQSALLEAMGEETVTVMGETRSLEKPFFVLATQNPLDLEGTYPLPEAQMDRFLAKIHVHYPAETELKEIVKRTTGTVSITLHKIMDAREVIHYQNLAREIVVADEMLDFAVKLIMATHPEGDDAPQMVKNYVRYGAGPRGLQSLIRMAKARSLLHGRYHVSTGDLKQAAFPVLRHRIFLNFTGEAEGIQPEAIIEEVIHHVENEGA